VSGSKREVDGVTWFPDQIGESHHDAQEKATARINKVAGCGKINGVGYFPLSKFGQIKIAEEF
jgi:hypothetical protein